MLSTTTTIGATDGAVSKGGAPVQVINEKIVEQDSVTGELRNWNSEFTALRKKRPEGFSVYDEKLPATTSTPPPPPPPEASTSIPPPPTPPAKKPTKASNDGNPLVQGDKFVEKDEQHDSGRKHSSGFSVLDEQLNMKNPLKIVPSANGARRDTSIHPENNNAKMEQDALHDSGRKHTQGFSVLDEKLGTNMQPVPSPAAVPQKSIVVKHGLSAEQHDSGREHTHGFSVLDEKLGATGQPVSSPAAVPQEPIVMKHGLSAEQHDSGREHLEGFSVLDETLPAVKKPAMPTNSPVEIHGLTEEEHESGRMHSQGFSVLDEQLNWNASQAKAAAVKQTPPAVVPNNTPVVVHGQTNEQHESGRKHSQGFSVLDEQLGWKAQPKVSTPYEREVVNPEKQDAQHDSGRTHSAGFSVLDEKLNWKPPQA